MSAAAPKSTYISSSGSLTARPLTVRTKEYVTGWFTLFYLFFETLLLPLIHTPAFADPNSRPAKREKKDKPSSGGTWGSGGGGGPTGGGGGGGGGGGKGGGGGGGSGGGGGAGGGGGWRGNSGGGFMTMGDLSGGGTVDGCRATCG